MLRTDNHPPSRKRPGRLFWIIGLAIGILGGAVVAVGLASVLVVETVNSSQG
nr:hypothetical protein [Polymorphobacter sp.]